MLMVILIIAAVILALALAASPRFGERWYRGMVFGPIKAVPDDYAKGPLEGASRENVYFKSKNGCMLHGVLFMKPGASKTCIFSHSNWGNVDEWSGLTAQLLAAGVSVFAYDYQGYGLSKGEPSIKGICDDGRAAYDYLVNERGVKPEDIVLFGSSLGSGVTMEVAKTRKVAGIILHAAFSSLRDLTIELMPKVRYLPGILFFHPGLENAVTAAGIDVPLLVVHGAYDEMVPRWQPELIHNAAKSRRTSMVILPSGSHMDTRSDGDLFVNSVAGFVQGL